MGINKIMTVLWRLFKNEKGMAKRNAEFYNKVFALFPKTVFICCSISHNILTVSNAY